MNEKDGENLFREIEAKCDNITIQKLALFLPQLRSALGYEFMGKTPRDILDWIEQGREFNQNGKLIEALNELELKVYRQSDPITYWETSQKIVDELKPDPIGSRNINLKDYKLKLLEKLRKVIPQDRLSIPIGKGWIKRRQKRDDLSEKNWPLFRNAYIAIFDLLKPFYPAPYTEVKKIIVALMRTEVGLKDVTIRDVNSALGYRR